MKEVIEDLLRGRTQELLVLAPDRFLPQELEVGDQFGFLPKDLLGGAFWRGLSIFDELWRKEFFLRRR